MEKDKLQSGIDTSKNIDKLEKIIDKEKMQSGLENTDEINYFVDRKEIDKIYNKPEYAENVELTDENINTTDNPNIAGRTK